MSVILGNIFGNGLVISAESPPPSGSGGSIFFDGSTYLETAASSDWDIGTGDFTVEWFLNQTNSSSFPRVFQFGSYPAPFGVSIEGGTFYLWMGGVAASTGVSYNTWEHMAVTRQSGTVRIFNDGVLKTTVTKTNNLTFTDIPMTIGADPGDVGVTMLDGNFTNFRYVVGTAVYTSTFTPPTGPLTAISGTKLLLLSTDSSSLLTDSSGLNHTVSAVTGTPSWSSNNPF